jgi:hypothetical protein
MPKPKAMLDNSSIGDMGSTAETWAPFLQTLWDHPRSGNGQGNKGGNQNSGRGLPAEIFCLAILGFHLGKEFLYSAPCFL